MNELAKKGIQAWSKLKKAKALPPELNIDPELIINCTDLQLRSIEELNKYNKLQSELDKISKQALEEKKIIHKAIDEFTKELTQIKNISFRVGSIGNHIYLITKTVHQANIILQSPELINVKELFLNKLKENGINIEILTDGWFYVYSDEQCDIEANGNWYYFFK